MSPYWDADASGIVVGMGGGSTRRVHLYRAILEGIAFELRLHAEGVEAALHRAVARLTAMGGGARSAGWRRIIADVTGTQVAVTEVTRRRRWVRGCWRQLARGCLRMCAKRRWR